MNTPNLRYFLYGIILTASITTLATQATGPDGVFGDYFQNMINNAGTCGAGTVVTGFDSTPGTNYGKRQCTTFDNLVNTVLKTFGSAPVGQAVIGYDTTTGSPIYGDVNWQRSGADISYTPGKVGIGIGPLVKLHTNGEARIEGLDNKSILSLRNSSNGNSWRFLSTGNGVTDANLYLGFTDGDINTNPSTPYSNALSIMRLSGNVGIGTDTPTAKLDVNGNIVANDVCLTSGVCLSTAAQKTDLSGAPVLYNLYNNSAWSNMNIQTIRDQWNWYQDAGCDYQGAILSWRAETIATCKAGSDGDIDAVIGYSYQPAIIRAISYVKMGGAPDAWLPAGCLSAPNLVLCPQGWGCNYDTYQPTVPAYLYATCIGTP